MSAHPHSVSIDFSALDKPLVGPIDGRSPAFEWRGLLIDSARTRFDVDTIITAIGLAGRYGFNVVHWHLTDDAGWRFAVPGYDKLASVAAHIPRDDFSLYNCLWEDSSPRAVEQAKTRWQDGYYTDEEIGKITAAAKAAGVEIVPEIDIPGHMMAAITAYPSLGRPADSPLPTESMRPDMFWPARNDLLWPTDEARKFITDVLDRVCDLFDGPRVHLGGDECAYKQWTSDPWLRDWMDEQGFTTPQQVQRWFFDLAKQHLASRGRTVVAWDEISEVTDEDDFEVIAWEEAKGLERIAKTNNRVVFADARYLYLNRIDPDGPADQKGMAPGISVNDILTTSWPLTESDRCFGLETCLWSEFVLDGEDMMTMLLPRLFAVAERMWNPGPVSGDAQQRVAAEYKAIAPALRIK